MSAPQTNIDRQKKRHRGPLLGIGAVVAFALALLLALSVWLTDDAMPLPENTPTGTTD